MSAMLFRGISVDIIFNGDDASKMVCNLVHVHLEDVLGHLQAERHAQDCVPVMVGDKCGEVGRFLIEVDAPEAILSIQLTEVSSTI